MWAQRRVIGARSGWDRATLERLVDHHLPTHLTSREKNKLTATQAQTVIAAAILRQLHAVITTGRAWDPTIATHGTRTVIEAPIAA